jgi:hypothetical protein
MAKAIEKPNSISALTQTPDGAVLTALVRRLRDRARAIKNPACTQMGQDMLAAALAIEQQLALPAGDLVGTLPTAEAMALAQMAKRFLYEDAERFSNRQDGGAERNAMLGGATKLQSALADAGFAAR